MHRRIDCIIDLIVTLYEMLGRLKADCLLEVLAFCLSNLLSSKSLKFNYIPDFCVQLSEWILNVKMEKGKITARKKIMRKKYRIAWLGRKEGISRGVDINKRTVTSHSYSLLFGHYICSCLFSWPLLGLN